MINSGNFERSQEAIIYVGNIDAKVNQALLCELFTQVGQVLNVHIPRDKITNQHSNYGFVEFKSQQDADYAIRIMHLVKLFGKPIKVNKTGGQDKRTLEVGANIFIGNLDPQVDEKLLYETFSHFGPVISTRIQRDADSGKPKGYGFVSFDRFEASDKAIANMHGQYYSGKQISVQYALKKDSKHQRHGTSAERLLAANRPMGEMHNPFEMGKQTISLNLPKELLHSELSLVKNNNSISPPLLLPHHLNEKSPQLPKVPELPLPSIPIKK